MLPSMRAIISAAAVSAAALVRLVVPVVLPPLAAVTLAISLRPQKQKVVHATAAAACGASAVEAAACGRCCAHSRREGGGLPRVLPGIVRRLASIGRDAG
jgi:hypothetical protein